MKEYNGHRSYNAWNVSLWLGGDEYYYDIVSDKIKITKLYWRELISKEEQIKKATDIIFNRLNYYKLEKTPDGAYFNRLSIKLFVEDMFDHID